MVSDQRLPSKCVHSKVICSHLHSLLITSFYSERQCKYKLSVDILRAQSWVHILFVPDAICQWNASTNATVIIEGRHLAGKAFPMPPSPLLDLIQTEPALCGLRLTLTIFRLNIRLASIHQSCFFCAGIVPAIPLQAAELPTSHY